jgi:uncharacterized iron-regulated protein
LLLVAASLAFGSVSAQNNSSVVDLRQTLKIRDLARKLEAYRVVLIGETHDRYAHHLDQLEIIRELHQRNPQLAIGLEAFQQPFQSVLDEYVNGAIDERQLLRNSEYFKRWGYDYRLYRPILEYAREQRIPLIALNIEREITNQVKQEGIDSLDDAQRQRLPDGIERSDEAYHERLREIFVQHPHAEEADFEAFLDVQLLWDEAMAEQASRFLRDNASSKLVVVAGAGHVIYRSGIPNRIQRRLPDTSIATVVSLAEVSALEPAMADFVVLADSQFLQPTGKFGVMLDTENDIMTVKEILETSNATDAGIKVKDIIVSIDGETIGDYYDLRMILMDKSPGDRVEVGIKRHNDKGEEKTLQIDLTLVE